jgi:hypothetical protein
MSSPTGEAPSGPLELGEILYIETKDGTQLAFEVVCILEDPDEGKSFAVLMHEPPGEDEEDREFIVTDLDGNLVEDDALAQEILDEFMVFAEEAGDEGGAG